jgi:hypothetical protein
VVHVHNTPFPILFLAKRSPAGQNHLFAESDAKIVLHPNGLANQIVSARLQGKPGGRILPDAFALCPPRIARPERSNTEKESFLPSGVSLLSQREECEQE